MIDRGIRDTLSEGALWSARDNAVYWVDILAPALNRLSLADGAIERWDMPEPLGWVVQDGAGGLIGGFRNGFARISLDALAVRPMADPEPYLPGNRMNDGKADRHGAIWCGTMEMAERDASGSLYRLAPDGGLAGHGQRLSGPQRTCIFTVRPLALSFRYRAPDDLSLRTLRNRHQR